MTTEQNKNMDILHSGDVHILYDDSLIVDVTDMALFDHAGKTLSDGDIITNTAQGRGDVIFFKYNNLNLVYKHYQRGGAVARFLHDQYFGMKLKNTRSFREWNLLYQLQILGLPSPVPVAARVIKKGLLYKADMIMKEIEDVATLADLCLQSNVEESVWVNVGQCIRQFHDNNVYHADLNARNILIGKQGDVHLIDFDKGCFREFSDSWKASNLSRLQRSLLKISSSDKPFHYAENNWNQLLDGYHRSQ